MRNRTVFSINKIAGLCAFLGLFLISGLEAKADDYPVIGPDLNGYPTAAYADGFEYQIKAEEAVVIGYCVEKTKPVDEKYSVIIPSHITYEGISYPVKAIGVCAFSKSGLRAAIKNDYRYAGMQVENVSIPNMVDAIGEKAFTGNDSLKKVVFGDNPSLIEFGSYAFSGCTQLNDFVFPKTIIRTGSYCFSGCESLTNIVLNEGIKEIGAGTFAACKALVTIQLPDSITALGASTFRGCENLTSIRIPTKIPAINGGTFAECYKLEKIVIPNNIRTIGASAFQSCYALGEDITLGDGVTTIGSRAFYDIPDLKNIAIPYQVTSIGGEAFGYYLSAAGTRDIPGFTMDGYFDTAAETYATSNNFRFRGKQKYGVVIKLEDADYVVTGDNTVLLSTITKTTITKYKVPTTITYKSRTFKVTDIEKWAFKDCSVLKEVEISPNIKTIGDNAFNGCKVLKKVTIGKNVTSIGKKAFYKCGELKTIKIKSKKIKTFGKKCFGSINKKAKVKVPKAKVKSYKKKIKNSGAPKKVEVVKG